MDISDKLQALASTAENSRDRLETEEATKNALVMPFIMNVLQYDVFNPKVVIPEFTADVGNRKGEKVDYAILNSDQEVIFLVECKRIGDALTLKHAQQLIRYFHASSARIGILTNGVRYEFYSDLDKPNVMDSKPFLEFDITSLRDHVIPEIKKMCRDHFDLDAVLSSANELKYTNLIIKSLKNQFEHPDDDFVKLFASRVHDGPFTQKIREQFTELVSKATKRFLSTAVEDRLKGALSGSNISANSSAVPMTDELSVDVMKSDGIETTQEELDGFNIVRAIARKHISVDRVVMRDTKSYCGVLLDDNNRKPICRLRFNSDSVKYLSVFNKEKNEMKHKIDVVDDIYKYAEEILAIIDLYDNSEAAVETIV